MTNRECIEKKIREMSDEKLADFLVENAINHLTKYFPPSLKYPFDKDLGDYVVKCLKWDWDLLGHVTWWLKEERKEDEK